MDSQTRQKVLVLDGHEFSTLAIVRSLGRQNLQVTVAAERGGCEPISGFSRYAHACLYYADPLVDPGQFVDDVLNIVKSDQFDLLIPVTDKTSVPLASYHQEIGRHTILAAPTPELLELANNKDKTYALADKLGIPIPKSIMLTDLTDLPSVLRQFSFPVVIKPSRSVADQDGDVRVKLSVQYAFSELELEQKCREILSYTAIVLQEYFLGDGVGVEVLADRGEVIYAFQHKRLHELPLTGGGSCLRESVAVDPQLLVHAQRLIQAMRWHGVAMVEFKQNASTNECRLIEVNGRFWGSLALAVNAGADFPYFLYQLLVQGVRTQNPAAAIGVQARKLREDLYWHLIVLFRRETSPLVVWPTARQLWRDFISVFSRRHHFDSIALDDLKPGAVDCLRTARWLANMFYQPLARLAQKLFFHWCKKNRLAAKRLPAAKHLLFICYGNINRSILAEKCLTAYLSGQGKNITVNSAGFYPKENRAADPNMIAVAQAAGIDLSACSSRLVTEQMLADADLVFVMEIKHFLSISEKFPQYRRKIHLLGSVASDIPLEIADPYGQTDEIYQRCFQQVNAASKIIAGLLA